MLAVMGAAFSTLATFLQQKGRINAVRAQQLNRVGYGCMGLSMLLFVVIGFRSRAAGRKERKVCDAWAHGRGKSDMRYYRGP